MTMITMELPPINEVPNTTQANFYKAGYERMYDGLHTCRQQLQVLNEQNKVLYRFYLDVTGEKDTRFEN